MVGASRAVSSRGQGDAAAEAGSVGELSCLACGRSLPRPLAVAGSLRCHDCRANDAPLSPWWLRLQELRRSPRSPVRPLERAA